MVLIKQLEELEANVARTMAENEELKARQEKWQVKKVALENANAEFAVAFAEKEKELAAKEKELAAKEKELAEAKAALEATKTELGAFKKREDAWAERVPKLLAQLSGDKNAPAAKNPPADKAEGKAFGEFKVLPPVPAPEPVVSSDELPMPRKATAGK